MDMERMTGMKRSKLRLAVALALVLTLLLALAPTAWAEEKGTSRETAYVYNGSNQGNFVGTKYKENQNLIFGAFANWVNEQLKKEDVKDLYIKIGANIVTTQYDGLRDPITIPKDKSLRLQLSNGSQVGSTYGEKVVPQPYFKVEPGGTLEITGNGWIINTEETKDDAHVDASIQDHALILNYGTTEIFGTIYLERKYNHTSEYSRQHTIINYGTLKIDGDDTNEVPGEYGVTIYVLSTAAGKYGDDGQIYVGQTTV